MKKRVILGSCFLKKIRYIKSGNYLLIDFMLQKEVPVLLRFLTDLLICSTE